MRGEPQNGAPAGSSAGRSGARFEPFVARVLSAELGCEVAPHDDGSRDGMHDLQIQLAGGVEPVEVKTVTHEA